MEGNLVDCYYLSDPQWWITAFNPEYPCVQAEDLTATFTVNFRDDIAMYYNFINSDDYKLDSGWSISPDDTYTLIYTF